MPKDSKTRTVGDNRGPAPNPHPVPEQDLHPQGARRGGQALLHSSNEDVPNGGAAPHQPPVPDQNSPARGVAGGGQALQQPPTPLTQHGDEGDPVPNLRPAPAGAVDQALVPPSRPRNPWRNSDSEDNGDPAQDDSDPTQGGFLDDSPSRRRRFFQLLSDDDEVDVDLA